MGKKGGEKRGGRGGGGNGPGECFQSKLLYQGKRPNCLREAKKKPTVRRQRQGSKKSHEELTDCTQRVLKGATAHGGDTRKKKTKQEWGTGFLTGRENKAAAAPYDGKERARKYQQTIFERQMEDDSRANRRRCGGHLRGLLTVAQSLLSKE